MSIRQLTILILFIVFVFRLSAQETKSDVVYLNNGTFLRGTISELVPGKSLKIYFNGHDTLEIPMSEVKEIKKEKVPEKSGYEDGVKSSGYTNITEFSVGLGYSEGINAKLEPAQKQFSISMITMNGFTISPYIQLGLGTGLELWKNRGFIPIYFDLRANILRHTGTPFFYANVGYAPGWMKGETGMGLGGAMAGLGAGARFSTGKVALVVSFGYRFQQTRQWQVVNQVRSKATLDANFFAIKAGVFF
jgi:hypothetical protein